MNSQTNWPAIGKYTIFVWLGSIIFFLVMMFIIESFFPITKNIISANIVYFFFGFITLFGITTPLAIVLLFIVYVVNKKDLKDFHKKRSIIVIFSIFSLVMFGLFHFFYNEIFWNSLPVALLATLSPIPFIYFLPLPGATDKSLMMDVIDDMPFED